MRPRYGVLITLVIVALLLCWTAAAPWWTAVFVLLDGVPDTEIGPGAFGGGWLLGAAAVAGAGYAVVALPFPVRVRRIALATSGAATALAVGALVVAGTRVLRQDAAAHREWTSQVWSHHLARRAESFDYFSVADTGSSGLALAMIATSLLVIVGLLLALPRRHERTVLIGATVAALLAAVLLPATGWVTSGPGTADRIWVWLPDHLDRRPAAVAGLLAGVLLVGAGLFLRPPHRVPAGVSRAWSIVLFIAVFGLVVAAGFLVMPPQLDDPIPYAGPAVDEGVRLNTPALLTLVLPYLVALRVGFLDAREPPAEIADPYLTAGDLAGAGPLA